MKKLSIILGDKGAGQMKKQIRGFFILAVVIFCVSAITMVSYAEEICQGIVIGNNLNLREKPSLSANIITKLRKNVEVTIMKKASDWYLIRTENGDNGWVYSDYIEIKSAGSFAKVTGNHVNLRTAPTLSGQVITQLFLNDDIFVKDLQGDWYHVITSANQEGWIYKDYVFLSSKEENSNLVSRSYDRKSAANLVDFAKKHLNKPYKYGGNGPDAFDCSGFAFYVYKNFGINLPRTSSEQAKKGTYVSKKDLDTGDLVFFDTSGTNDHRINHVGIYIGNGDFIHASSGKNSRKVVISNINEGYYKEKYVTARRIL